MNVVDFNIKALFVLFFCESSHVEIYNSGKKNLSYHLLGKLYVCGPIYDFGVCKKLINHKSMTDELFTANLT